MPIYAYKCASCGHAKDVLQKLSESPLTVCPACGAESFSKQVTAAGFQLKGSGWYATDFRNGSTPPAAGKSADKAADNAGSAGAKPAEAKPDSPKPAEGGSTKPDAPAASAGACL
jgi:putative FmdB family regulatory protein